MANIFTQPCDEGVIRAGPSAVPCAALSEPWILAATILGSSMAFIDGTVVNVALPALQKRLNATVLDVQWVVESYALFLAALLLTGGSMGDRFGRRRIFCAGVVLFALASIGGGMAQSVNQLIVARAAQGVAGALLVPGSLAIISAAFDEQRRGRAIGTWSGFTAITAGVGPATLGLGTLVYGLIESSRLGFDHPIVLGALFGGVISLAIFFLNEALSPNPMLPLALFRSRNFSGANLLTLFLYTALGGGMFFFPLNLIQVQGYSATAAGAAWLPFILILFLLSRWSGGLVKQYGAKAPLVAGPGIAALGSGLFMVPGVGGSSWTTFFPAMVVLGLGMAVSVAPLTTTVMNAVPANRAGVASGVNNAVSRIGGLLGIAVLGIVIVHSFNRELDGRLARMDLSAQVRLSIDEQRTRLAGAELLSSIDERTRIALKQAINESFVFGFRLVMLTAAGLALVSAFVALAVIENR